MELDNEIIESFKEEAKLIIDELRDVVDVLEESSGEQAQVLLKDFANKADRIMGTAKTFETMYPGHGPFQQIGKFGELCKATGYKASTLNVPGLVPIFVAFWADTLDILEELCLHVESEERVANTTKEYGPVLQKRLTWLAQQIVSLTKGAGASDSQINVDGILRRMGIDV